jgi:hypothetical protein
MWRLLYGIWCLIGDCNCSHMYNLLSPPPPFSPLLLLPPRWFAKLLLEGSLFASISGSGKSRGVTTRAAKELRGALNRSKLSDGSAALVVQMKPIPKFSDPATTSATAAAPTATRHYHRCHYSAASNSPPLLLFSILFPAPYSTLPLLILSSGPPFPPNKGVATAAETGHARCVHRGSACAAVGAGSQLPQR